MALSQHSKHAELFKGHGMDPGASCHTLETKPLSAEERAALKEQIVAAISGQENCIDKYNILWDRMKTFNDIGSHRDWN